MKLKLFFKASKSVASRLTETFDFVWPTAAAIWNLRWQVSGLVSILPNITESELLGRFVNGSGIRGANLKKACIDTSWEEQQQQFAKFLLLEFCALYENWCELMVSELNLPGRFRKEMQFPTSQQSTGIKGVAYVLSQIASSQSIVMRDAFHQLLATNRKYSIIHIEELLTCYRYFKELRNLLIHGANGSNQSFMQAEADFSSLTASKLGVSEVPKHHPSSSGAPPQLSLRGIVGFGEIVLKIVCTLDIEFSSTTFAATNLIKRWRAEHGNTPLAVAANDRNRRSRRIRILTAALDLPPPIVTTQYESWLRQERLVFF